MTTSCVNVATNALAVAHFGGEAGFGLNLKTRQTKKKKLKLLRLAKVDHTRTHTKVKLLKARAQVQASLRPSPSLFMGTRRCSFLGYSGPFACAHSAVTMAPAEFKLD